MKIKAIGKRKGISKKSGKPYFQVFYLDDCHGGEGKAGDSLFLEEDDFAKVTIGGEYNAEFSKGGFLTSFKPC